jgi:hypothetical protein
MVPMELNLGIKWVKNIFSLRKPLKVTNFYSIHKILCYFFNKRTTTRMIFS